MLVFIPILAMLALEFVMPGKKKVSAPLFFLILGGACFLFLLFRSLIPASLLDPEGEAVVRVQSQVDYLLKRQGWQQHPVIILVGSSATQYGVNGHALEQLLIEAGVPVTVLQFSLSGANHFERLFMLRLFLKEIGAKHQEELKKAPTILLSEVFDAYDQSPLYLFKKESYSRRAMTWFEPIQAWAAWKAWRAGGEDREISYWMLSEHFLLNRFAVGIFSTLEMPHYNKKAEAFFPLTGTKKTFHYNETEKIFRETKVTPLTRIFHGSHSEAKGKADETRPKQDFDQGCMSTYPSDQNSTTTQYSSALAKLQTERHEISGVKLELYPGWKNYYQTLFQEMSGIVSFCGFYALPTLEPQRCAYQEAFADSLPAHTTMLGPASTEVMRSLLHQEYWFDGVHPQGQGAILVTSWLAQEILEKWPQLLETRWRLAP